MAQKKRGTNPIRITLTEDQISDIIQSAAKTRRGLKVESLEDRIAPSVIGGPMFDPGMSGGDLSGNGAPPPAFDPSHPAPGLPGEPSLPQGPYDPTMPPLTDTPNPPFNPNPTLPGDGPPLPGLPQDPNANIEPIPQDGPHGVEPLPGENPPGFVEPLPQEPAPGGIEPLNPEPTPGAIETPPDPDAALNRHGGIGNANVPAHHAATPLTGDGAGVANQMPSSQEVEEHRRNILRQLRGN